MRIDFSKLIPIFAFCMALFLPIHTGLSNLFLILIFVASFFTYVIQKKFIKRNPKALVFTLLPIFLLYAVGLLYSDPPFFGTKTLGQTVSFVLCPLTLLFLPIEILKRSKAALLKGIIIGSLVSVSFLLINNFLNYYATRPFPSIDDEFLGFYYTYHKFTQPFIEFASYLGAYVVLSIFLLYRSLFLNKKWRWLSGLGIFILSIGIVYINARVVILLYIIVTVGAIVYASYLFLHSKKILHFIILMLFSIGISISAFQILSGSFIGTRMNEELQWELSDQKNSGYNKELIADSRIPRWKSALQLIVEKPFFGYGTYMEKTVLAKQYEKNGLWSSLKNRYDAHNMYLSFSISFGLVGLFFYLIFLISNFWLAIKGRYLVYFFFLFMVATLSIFESYLLNNAGITFTALFLTIFLYVALFDLGGIFSSNGSK